MVENGAPCSPCVRLPLDANYGREGRWGMLGCSVGQQGFMTVGCGRGGCCTSLLYSGQALLASAARAMEAFSTCG